MKTSEILKAAKRNISIGFCQLAYAQDAEGGSVNYDSPNAAAFCALGAIYAVPRSGAMFKEEEAARYLKSALPIDYVPAAGLEGTVAGWNDEPGRTHAEVLALYDRAIALAEAEEAIQLKSLNVQARVFTLERRT